MQSQDDELGAGLSLTPEDPTQEHCRLFFDKILCIAITLSGSITQPMMSEEIKMSSTPKFLTATSCYWQIWMVIGLRAVPKITTLSFMLRSLGLTTWMWFTMDEDQEIMVKEGWNSCGYSGLNTVASTQPWAGCIFNWMPYNFHHCQRTAHLDLLIQMTCFEELPLFPHLQLDRLTWIVWACQYSQGMQKTGKSTTSISRCSTISSSSLPTDSCFIKQDLWIETWLYVIIGVWV